MDATKEVKERLAIEDIVGEYIPLKRSGRNYQGLCPFHQEKTPSFMVNPERGIYHCFGCNEGGDILSFVMKMEGLEFREALEKLARRAGVDLEQFRSDPQAGRKKEQLQRIMELSVRYYQETLLRNRHALDYALNVRGLDKATLSSFQIGYAPLRGNGLVDFLKQRGYLSADIRAAGLTSRDNKDLFRGRLMIPLLDNQGRAIGFTGRIFDNNAFGPKYLNSPQTLVYDKSRHVFGLSQAKQAIREQAKVVLVEGNMDVIASHQAGIKHVVATAGTALTIDQLRQLGRLADKLVLAFDNDKAGLAATMRAIELSQRLPIGVYVAALSGGKDPDELVRSDKHAWLRAIDGASYALDWIVAYQSNQYNIDSAPGKVAFTDALMTVLRHITDPVEQEHYVAKVAHIAQTHPATLLRKLGVPDAAEPVQKRAVVLAFPDEYRKRLDSLLALMLVYPETRVALDELDNVPVELTDSQKEIFMALRKKSGKLPESDSFATILTFKAEELYKNWEPKERAVEAIELAQRLAHETKRRILQKLSRDIAEAEARGDQDTADQLLQRSRQLTAKE